MGDPLSPILIDIYIHYLEEKISKLVNFDLWVRYVDDTFVLWPGNVNDLPNVLETINSIDPSIIFTFEPERNNIISFLDVLVERKEDRFETSVFRKTCSVERPPHKKSLHSGAQKMSAFHFYIQRAINICSTSVALKDEIHHIRRVARNRGYEDSIVDFIFHKIKSKGSNISRLSDNIDSNLPKHTAVIPFLGSMSYQIAKILRKHNFRPVFRPMEKIRPSALKEPLKLSEAWGIYKILCQCGLGYIGQTRRSIATRVAEHQRYVKNQETTKSSIAQHCWNEEHHFRFSEAKIISSTQYPSSLNFLEAFLIHKYSHDLVNDSSSTPYLSNAWLPLIHK